MKTLTAASLVGMTLTLLLFFCNPPPPLRRRCTYTFTERRAADIHTVGLTDKPGAALKHIWPRLGDDGLCSPQQAAAAAADAGNSCPVIGRAVLPCVSHWRQETVGNRKKKGTWPD